jgi:hypothetical protein
MKQLTEVHTIAEDVHLQHANAVLQGLVFEVNLLRKQVDELQNPNKRSRKSDRNLKWQCSN